MERTELKRLAEAASKGPWHVRAIDQSIGSIDNEAGDMIAQAQMIGTLFKNNNAQRQANTEYIAAANPSAILELLSELEAKEAQIVEMRKVINGSALLLQELRSSREADIERAIRFAVFQADGYPFPADAVDKILAAVLSQLKEQA